MAMLNLYAATLLFLLSVGAFCVNSFGYHYPGNNYFPTHSSLFAITLVLMYGGFSLQFGRASVPARIVKEIMFYFLVMCVIAFATNAAQYTPFPTIDKSILSIETSLHIDLQMIVSWTHAKPMLKTLLTFIYDTLPFQMTYLPLFIIATGRIHYIREYYFFLLVSAIIGFSFYYFFPTTAPASMFAHHYFSTEQQATGLKFMQIHQHIQPSTIEGGMIALPSFHVIWAWFCLYLLRGWALGILLLLPINLLLMLSCALLGWHYPIDILGGFIVIFFTHGLYYLLQKKSGPSSMLARPILRTDHAH